MLDNRFRPYVSPVLDQLGRLIARSGISANHVTVTSFAVGMAAALAIAMQAYGVGLVLLLVSRLGDGLDGAVARATQKTDFGGYLDIVLDFAFYGAIPLGFVFADVNANAVAGAVLLLSFYVNGASFLAFAIMMEKNGISDNDPGSKSLFFSTGLAEATETYAVFVAACLFPAWFPLLAYGFALLCFYTALSRIMQARRVLTQNRNENSKP
jgi:phosphatidylglycerophosphate synthase